MVYYPFFPVSDYIQLACGVLMIIPAFYAVKKVSEGSKNMFAYVLLSFTVLLGISYVGLSFDDMFRREVVLPDRTHYFGNMYALKTC